MSEIMNRAPSSSGPVGEFSLADDIGRIYRAPLDELDNPLANMAEWVSTGAPADFHTLRRAGLTDDWSAATPYSVTTTLQRVRHEWFLPRFGFSIPCAESVRSIYEHRPIIEVAAGTGYYGAMVNAAGGDVVSTDATPVGERAYHFRVGRWNPDLIGGYDGAHAALDHRDRTVMLSWGGYSDEGDWQCELLRAIRPGRRLILFGEPSGGCTTCDAFFDLLEEEFHEVREVRIPTFPHIHDRMTIHERKGMRVRFDPSRLP